MNKSELVGDVIKTWLERGEDRPTFCYGVDRAHAQHLAQRFADGAAIDSDKIAAAAKAWRAFHAALVGGDADAKLELWGA